MSSSYALASSPSAPFLPNQSPTVQACRQAMSPGLSLAVGFSRYTTSHSAEISLPTATTSACTASPHALESMILHLLKRLPSVPFWLRFPSFLENAMDGEFISPQVGCLAFPSLRLPDQSFDSHKLTRLVSSTWIPIHSQSRPNLSLWSLPRTSKNVHRFPLISIACLAELSETCFHLRFGNRLVQSLFLWRTKGFD